MKQRVWRYGPGRLLTVSLLLLCATATAEDTAQEILKKVQKKYDSITDAKLTFAQRVRFEMSKVEQKVDGTLYLKKTNKYRVEYGDRTIVTNGTTVWSYSTVTNQVLVDHFKQDERSLTPERLLTASPEDYYATVVGREKLDNVEAAVLKLVPKDNQAFIRSLRLWIDTSSWLIRMAEVVDVHGKETSYSVKEARLNTGIADASFTYQIPEGAEVVDLR